MSPTSESGPSMQAVVVRAPGGPEMLEHARVLAPVLSPGSVEIDVRAFALNRADLLQRRGHYPPPPGASELLGLECAGVVRAVAPGVSGFEPGDRVMALLSGGAYAERVVSPAGLVLPIPAELSFEQAAAIPEAFLTASEALFTLGQTGPESVVLIHAGASGVGTAALQLAQLAGARVLATAGSHEKVAWLRELGVDRAIHYPSEDFAEVCHIETKGRGVDVVLDFVGASYAERHQHCLAEAGRWVVLGLLGGSRASLDLSIVLRRRLQVLGFVLRSRALSDKCAIVDRFRSRFHAELERGRLRPIIDRVYPWSEIQAAHERMERNENRGKIVLSIPGV